MCAPSPPPAPDYGAAARQQGIDNIEAARLQGRINNPNTYGPTGSQVTTWDGDTPTTRQTLSPKEQAIYDANADLRAKLGNLGSQGADSLKGLIGTQLDFSGVPNTPASYDEYRREVEAVAMGRFNEDIGRQEDTTRSKLIAAGIPVGSEAHDREMQRFDRSRVDARNQAVLSSGQEASRSYGVDSDRRKSIIAELLTKRQTPLNEISALMSGSQVNNPFAMPGYASNTSVSPAPSFAGAQAAGNDAMQRYNAQVGGQNSLTSGLFGLGAAAVGRPSDIRLKSNIVRIGTHPSGLPWYEYDIFGKREQGVMAQEAIEVKPEAVHMMPNGYYAVDYGRL